MISNCKSFTLVYNYTYAKASQNGISICIIDIYPTSYKDLDAFRAKVKEYFEKRTDKIKRVIKCEIADHGNIIKLVTEVSVKRGWSFFFNDPPDNYGDLEGIRTVRHSCQDLGKCDNGSTVRL